MKKCLNIIILTIFTLIISVNNYTYGTERFVDIPVPDNSTGFADSTLSEKEKQIKEYEEKQKNNNNEYSENVENNTDLKQNNDINKNTKNKIIAVGIVIIIAIIEVLFLG